MRDDEHYSSLTALFAALTQVADQVNTPLGIRQQRLRTSSPCDLFISVRQPTLTRELTVRFHKHVLPAEFGLPEFRSLEVRQEDEIESGVLWCKISICVSQAAFNDIFISFVEDITRSVAKPADESKAAQTFQHRLHQWQQLLQKVGPSGLTEEQQQGLYGELWTLREVVMAALPTSLALATWTGPEATDRDFQFSGSIALEVKTTRSSGAPMLAISSERQLDDTGINFLYVLQLALERKAGAGETLPQIVESLVSRIGTDPHLNSMLQDKLLSAGFLESQVTGYRSTGYTLHGTHLYHVRHGFPRITPDDLLQGVGNVRYVISAVACQPFATDIHAFAAQLGASR